MNQSELKTEQFYTTGVLKPILFSLLILISGIVIGVGLTLIITGGSTAQKTLPPGPEYMSGRMLRRITRELNLSDLQQRQLTPIVRKHTKAMEDIRQQARPEISKELKEMNEEILGILDEPQKEIWQDRIQRMQEHFTQMRHRRNPNSKRRHRKRPDGIFPPEEKLPIDDRMPHELHSEPPPTGH